SCAFCRKRAPAPDVCSPVPPGTWHWAAVRSPLPSPQSRPLYSLSSLEATSHWLPASSKIVLPCRAHLYQNHWQRVASLSRLFRQHERAASGDGHSVLEVRAIAAVLGHGRPLVVEHARARLAHIDHRFNGQHHALT